MKSSLPDTQTHTQNIHNIHVPGGIQTDNPSNQPATDPRLTPRGHQDQQVDFLISKHITRVIILMEFILLHYNQLTVPTNAQQGIIIKLTYSIE